MDRRTFCAAATAGLLGVSGCSALRRLLPGHQLPPYVQSDVTVVAEGGVKEGFPGPTDPPAVDFHQSGARIEVTGHVFVGTRACNKAGLQSIRYDGDARVLSADVGSVDEEHSGQCGAEETADAYRLVVEFEKTYPAVVEVTEGHGGSKQTTTARR